MKLVKVWWNKTIDKYQFKVYLDEEDIWTGTISKSRERGLERLREYYPQYTFKLEEE